jgi:hypothetical protein
LVTRSAASYDQDLVTVDPVSAVSAQSSSLTVVVAWEVRLPSAYAVTRPQLSYVVDARPVFARAAGLCDAVWSTRPSAS